MFLDLFFRAEDPITMRTVLKSATFQNFIGNLTDPDDTNNLLKLRDLVEYKYFRPNYVVITPGVYDENGNEITPPVYDSWCWLHLRLIGQNVNDDLINPGDPDPDHWNKSRIVDWMKNNGTLKTIRGCTVFEYIVAATGNKAIQVWRGKDMDDNGVLFHQFLGGNVY